MKVLSQTKSSAVARGLFKQVACVKFFFLTALMCDVLIIIQQLSKTFQTVDFDLSLIKSDAHLALTKLDQLKTAGRKNGNSSC